jgi:RecA-family ATPase
VDGETLDLQSYTLGNSKAREAVATSFAVNPALANGSADADTRQGRTAYHRAIVDQLTQLEIKVAKIKSGESIRTANVIELKDVEVRPIHWLWPGRIPKNRVTILAGDPDAGKSFVTLDIAARVSASIPWPDGCHPATAAPPNSRVLILSAEDNAHDTIKPRLLAMHANCDNIRIMEGVSVTAPDGDTQPYEFDLDYYLDVLETQIAQYEPVMAIIDPIHAYMGDVDSHKNSEVRKVLKGLGHVAERTETTFLAVMHLNKNTAGKAIHRASGSGAYTAAARAVHLAVKDKDDHPEDEADRRRLLLTIKLNIARHPPGLAYRIGDDLQIEWGAEPVTTTADEALAETSPKRGPAPEEREACKEALLEYLGDHGTSPVNAVTQHLRDYHEHSQRTIDRARTELKKEGKIAYDRIASVCYWKPVPKKED